MSSHPCAPWTVPQRQAVRRANGSALPRPASAQRSVSRCRLSLAVAVSGRDLRPHVEGATQPFSGCVPRCFRERTPQACRPASPCVRPSSSVLLAPHLEGTRRSLAHDSRPTMSSIHPAVSWGFWSAWSGGRSLLAARNTGPPPAPGRALLPVYFRERGWGLRGL